MPPFRLEAPERLPTHSRKPQIIYTKNLYSEGVKVEYWQELLEHHPIDVDPYCQGKVNYFLSHYHRLGTRDDKSFRTTTGDMLQQVFIKDKIYPTKKMKSFYTFNENAECLTKYPESQCRMICADEFLTSMQHSYQMPRPYVMQRLGFPKIPFMRNEKYRHDPPDLSSEKFYGDSFGRETCQLQKYKGFRTVSYNPMTGNYTKSH
ncbi:uncharacterized protein LOC123012915 [Tribolium madens]|uniref:uncharacterized protein LOC123012915 n=1 Tax=Tribolium madens TaxID=41895 RepID=UPI001CF728B4|nr:uncharacterized protein LOC123012915 [Tribolium madens]